MCAPGRAPRRSEAARAPRSIRWGTRRSRAMSRRGPQTAHEALDFRSDEKESMCDWTEHSSVERGWRPGKGARADIPSAAHARRLGLSAEQLRDTLPIGRFVGPADVAALAMHIMSNTARRDLRHRRRPA